MSIVTLKKKSEAKYRNLSTGQPQFSIQGVRRLQGYIGQTSLSRNLPKTLKRGTEARGHGGCCGHYSNHEILPQDIWTMEDGQTVKPSVLSTAGMISTKYQWVRRPQPFSVWKPDISQVNSSGVYTEHLGKNCSKEQRQKKCAPPMAPNHYTNGCGIKKPSAATCTLTKNIAIMTQSAYIESLAKQEDIRKPTVVAQMQTPLPGS